MKGQYTNGLVRFIKEDELIRHSGDTGVTVREIAAKLYVSVRTIQRDIHYLEIEFGAPIIKQGDRYLYAYSWSLADIAFSTEEFASLYLATSIMRSIFQGTNLEGKLLERFYGITRHCQTNLYLKGVTFCSDAVQVALPLHTSYNGSEEFITAVQNRLCCFAELNGRNIEMRPIKIIFAWNNCYLLYITKDYKENKDFHIEQIKKLTYGKELSPAMSKKIPDIFEGMPTAYPVEHAYSKLVQHPKYGEILEIRFQARASDYYLLRYKKNADGSLTFICDEETKDSGHIWDKWMDDMDKAPKPDKDYNILES